MMACHERLTAATLDYRHDALDLPALAVGGAVCGSPDLPSRLTISCRYGVVATAVAERCFLATDQAVNAEFFPAEAVVGFAVIAGVSNQLAIGHSGSRLGCEWNQIAEVATGSWPDHSLRQD
jgi:hypothetical protein